MSAGRFQTVGDLAAATIDVLDERGWCQMLAEADDGSVCVGGAANVAAYGQAHRFAINPYRTPANQALAAALDAVGELIEREPLEEGDYWLPYWNDGRSGLPQSLEDVKLALKHAAESTEPCPDLTIGASR